MVFPVIKRISPELSCSRKSIRRASGNTYRQILFIKLKKLRLCPGICAVKSNIDRHISDDLHTFIVSISLQLCPLLKEPELLETIKCHFSGKFFPDFLKRCLISVLQLCRPFNPADAAKAVLDSHIQAVILKPRFILFNKLLIFCICLTI